MAVGAFGLAPESPRWLATNGHLATAAEVRRRLGYEDNADIELWSSIKGSSAMGWGAIARAVTPCGDDPLVRRVFTIGVLLSFFSQVGS